MQRLRDLVIVGAGGHAREVAAAAEAARADGAGFRLIGLLDDTRHGHAGKHEILGTTSWLETRSRSALVFIGVGNPNLRRSLVLRLEAFAVEFVSVLHPTAWIARSAKVDVGLYAGVNAIISEDVAIHRHVHINVGATVSHDCTLAEFATLAPGVHLAGTTNVGAAADVGTGVVSVPGVRIGAGTVVGAGAVVTRDLPDGVTAVGVPARPLSR